MNARFTLSDTFLAFTFLISPFVDSLSGAMILSGLIPEGEAGSLSQMLRLIILVLCFFILLKSIKYFYGAMALLFYIIIFESIFALFHGSAFGFVIGLVYGSKIAYVIMVFLALRAVLDKGLVDVNTLYRCIQFYVVSTAILLIVPFVFGVGFSTYSEGTFGVKGFFSAGNGLGIFLGVGLLFLIHIWQTRGGLHYLPILLMVLLATLLVGTKTSIIMGGVGLAAMLFYLNRYIAVVISLTALVFVLSYADVIFELTGRAYDVIFYRYSNSDGLLSFILSNRDVYVHDAIANFSVTGLSAFRLLTGFGAFVSFRAPTLIDGGIDTLESDFADLYFMYGVLSVLYLGFIFLIIARSVKSRSYFLGFVFFLLAAHSILAGHVIFNGMSGTMLSLLAASILSIPSNKRQPYSSFALFPLASKTRLVVKSSAASSGILPSKHN